MEPDRFHPDDRRGALNRDCRDPRTTEAVDAVNLACCDTESSAARPSAYSHVGTGA